MRGQKTAKEIKLIQKGSQIIDEIFWELLIILKTRPGLTELKVALMIRKLAKEKGAQGMAFPPIVSFGKNAAEIHHSPNSTKIGKNNFLMLDYGVKVNGYCTDFTRTLFLGRPNKFQKKIYNIVLKSQLSALKKIKPGKICGQIDLAARRVIKNAGYGKYYNHGTGHGVGKQIHEWPSFKPGVKDTLPINCVMTVEPGIYLPSRFGVRIEDMIWAKGKPKIFSKVPKDLKSMTVSF